MSASAKLPETIPFWKMSGAGNDFILIDNRTGVVSADAIRPVVPRICAPHVSLGADGLILIEPSARADFRWRFFNADGSEAEMCGNGSRCAARFAHLGGIAPARMTFETIAGLVQAEVRGDRVRVRLTDPHGLNLDIPLPLNEEGNTLEAHFVNTGVPHTVVFVDELDAFDVRSTGRSIRFHDRFAPAGTNANFVRVDGRHAICIRTYERGVEAETLACGTGSVASAVVAAARGLVESPVTLTARSGIGLTVHFIRKNGSFGRIDLEGDARIICKGELAREAWT